MALLFIVANVGLSFVVKDNASVVGKYGIESLRKVYSGRTVDDIQKLLLETWTRPQIYQPFTQFKERPSRGEYVNVSDKGFRLSSDQAEWPPNPNNFNIFVFGGSTTFGYGVADAETIPSHLQRALRDQNLNSAAVYNFGRGNYYSTQERALFAQLLLDRTTPHMAIFIDGLNEFYYHGAGEPAFTARLREIMDRPATIASTIETISANLRARAENLPLSRLVRSLACRESKCPEPANDQEAQYRDPDAIDRTIDRYLSNKKMIEAIAAAYDVKPIFVVQPVPTYKYNQENHLFAAADYGQNSYSIYGYPALREKVANMGPADNLVWCADLQEGRNEPLYVDLVHYSGAFSGVVASCIVESMKERQPLTELIAPRSTSFLSVQ